MVASKFIKVVTYAYSYNHLENNVKQLNSIETTKLLNWILHLSIPFMSYSLIPKLFSTSYFSQYIHHKFLTGKSKLFKPVCLPNPNCN